MKINSCGEQDQLIVKLISLKSAEPSETKSAKRSSALEYLIFLYNTNYIWREASLRAFSFDAHSHFKQNFSRQLVWRFPAGVKLGLNVQWAPEEQQLFHAVHWTPNKRNSACLYFLAALFLFCCSKHTTQTRTHHPEYAARRLGSDLSNYRAILEEDLGFKEENKGRYLALREYGSRRLRHNGREKCQSLDCAAERNYCNIQDAIFQQHASRIRSLSNTQEGAFPLCSSRLDSQTKSGRIRARIEKHSDRWGTARGKDCIW